MTRKELEYELKCAREDYHAAVDKERVAKRTTLAAWENYEKACEALNADLLEETNDN